MPKAPLPADVADLFARPNPAVVAVLRPSGAPMSVATWYLVERSPYMVLAEVPTPNGVMRITGVALD